MFDAILRVLYAAANWGQFNLDDILIALGSASGAVSVAAHSANAGGFGG